MENQPSGVSLDEILIQHGGLSLLQVLVITFCCVTAVVGAVFPQTPVMFSAIPNHRCLLPIDNDTDFVGLSSNWSDSLSSYIPFKDNEEYDSCKMFNFEAINDTNSSINFTGSSDYYVTKCKNGWYYDKTYFEQTTISEWDLVCDRQILDSIANSIFLSGGFFGSLFVGSISDWFGRKPTIIGALVVFVTTSFGSSFITNFWTFVFIRFIAGMFALSSTLTNTTYLLEMVDINWKNTVSAIVTLCMASGRILVPGIAYFVRDWRTLNVIYTVINVPSLIGCCFIPESPRWLLANGKLKRVEQLLKKIAQSNNCPWNEKLWNKFIKRRKSQNSRSMEKRYSLKDLFGSSNITVLTVTVILCWFSNSLVSYGLSLNGGNLSGNPYLNITLNALAEVVAAILFLATNKLNLRPRGLVALVTAGVCCLLSIMNDDGGVLTKTAVAMAIIGKLFATLGYSVIRFLTLASYPTKIRSTAYCIGAAGARFGAIISPFAIYLQFSVPWLTPMLFGIITIIAGSVCLLFPETRNSPLITTLEEANLFYAEEMKMYNKIKKVIGRFKMKETKQMEQAGIENKAYDKDIIQNTLSYQVSSASASSIIVATEF